ncbi:leucine-rich repeat flightless-interacting protein 1 isoform X4 [Dipodomys merriami]|uniref:leucine-rich repeat flightless-interacting protein 1 isoform X4 n=1 Tax=Dipodomys merriami TaxID=94247 RepID=UPI00384E6CD6
MGTQGAGRRRLPNRERLTAEDDALNQIAREAEARLAAKRAARAEAREIRMRELERQQKEIYQVQKKYYGLDTKWGDIEQWMEDSERYSRRSRRNTSASDEDERMSVGSRGSLRTVCKTRKSWEACSCEGCKDCLLRVNNVLLSSGSPLLLSSFTSSWQVQSDLEYRGPHAWTNGCDGERSGSQSLSRRSGRNSGYSGGDGRMSSRSSSREEKLGLSCSDLRLPCSGLTPKPFSAQASVLEDSSLVGARRGSVCGSYHAPSEYSGHLNSSSRASSRASSARASPVVEERPEKDFTEKGSRNMPGLSAATLASLGGTSSRRGSGDTSISMDTEASIREIKDSLAEVEEKYKKAMVSNAQLDNEKTNFMYQVDTLKDTLLELEEQLAESQRLYEEKSKELEREKHAHCVLQFQFAEVKEALKQREEMLEEIRQLQQKQASYIREISDLQETIEWKDKKIGALERQKEFFDSIRSERDDLREEIAKLKEELKKHGIILNSEIATNGETSDTLNNVGYQGPTKVTKEEFNALQSAGDGALGRANGVEVKKEIVETVGKRETSQHAEQEQHEESTGEACVDRGGWLPGEGAERRGSSEHSASGPLASAGWEGQVQGQSLGNPCESPERVGSSGVADLPDGGAGAPPEQSGPRRQVDGEPPGPGPVPHSEDASDTQNHSENAEASRERAKPEDVKTDVEPSRLESVPGRMPETEKMGRPVSGDPEGNHVESEVVAKGAEAGEHAGAAASGPPAHGRDSASPDRTRTAEEWDSGLGLSLERELPNQEGAKLRGTPMQSPEAARESTAEEEGGVEPVDEEPVQTDGQTPRAQAAAGSPGRADTENAADVEKSRQQGEALDSSQKKTKNKKKKNKKKKAQAPVESLQDVKDTLTRQNTGAGGAEDEGQVPFADKNRVTKALNKMTKNPKQEIGIGRNDYVDCPENPEMIPEDNGVDQREGEVTADGDTLTAGEGTGQSAGTRASDELDGQATKSDAGGVTQSSPAQPKNGVGNGSSPPQNESPSHGIEDGQHSGQTAGKVLDSISLDNDDLSASAGELGDLGSEGAGSEQGKSKEDCTMS